MFQERLSHACVYKLQQCLHGELVLTALWKKQRNNEWIIPLIPFKCMRKISLSRIHNIELPGRKLRIFKRCGTDFFFKRDIWYCTFLFLEQREREREGERSSSYKHNLFFCETSEILLILQTLIANCTKELMHKGTSKMNSLLFEEILEMEDDL